MIPSSRWKGEFCFQFPSVSTPSPEFWLVGFLCPRPNFNGMKRCRPLPHRPLGKTQNLGAAPGEPGPEVG